jgi:phosphoglycerate dehydrogenase-like enzyme
MSVVDATVLVTPRSFGVDDPGLRDELEAIVDRVVWRPGGARVEELGRLVSCIDGWIAGVEPIGAEILDRATRLRVIARYGVGVDNVDLTCAQRCGITVTNTPGANAAAVAELTLGLVLALARRIPMADRAVRSGRWAADGGVGLEGKTLGLVGLGAVGQAVARRAGGFGMRVIAHDPRHPTGPPLAGAQLLELDAVVAESDFISLHAALTESTRGVVDASFLAAMKPGAFLVNTARGELVDETALADSLRDGALAGAALDALCEEPPTDGFALGTLPNVVLTPHLGAQTDNARRAMGRRALENCLAVLTGRPPADAVTVRTGVSA